MAKASQACSEKTLHGTYGGVVSGLALPGGVPGSTPQPITAFEPFGVLEVVSYDGSGNVQIHFTASVGGTPSYSVQLTGTYAVSPNCTGSATATSGPMKLTFDFIVFHGGKEIRYIETDGSAVAAFTHTRMQDEPDK